MPEPPKERVFEVLREVAEQLDNITPKEREQIMTMLYARYDYGGVTLPSSSKKRYGYAPKRKPTTR